MSTRDARFLTTARTLGYDFSGELKIGGHYTPLLRHGDQLFVSGQIPRVGDAVVVTGRLGDEVTLAQGQRAAQVCVMRALALLQSSLGSLDQVAQILRITVFVASTPGFTLHSEVADGASDTLHAVLGEAGVHTRSSVGVCMLPKNAAVEIDLIAAARP